MEGLLNLTPHTLHIFTEDTEGDTAAYVNQKKGQFRLIAAIPSHGSLRAFPIGDTDLGDTLTIDDQEISVVKAPSSYRLSGYDLAKMKGSRIVVSKMVAELMVAADAMDPTHIYGANSGPAGALRDKEGKIIGVLGLIQYK